VRDQSLVRRQFQLELVMQELPDLRFDLLGLLPGTGKAQQPVIGVPAVVQPPIALVVRVAGGHRLHLLA
jgi:hypothetical protein